MHMTAVTASIAYGTRTCTECFAAAFGTLRRDPFSEEISNTHSATKNAQDIDQDGGCLASDTDSIEKQDQNCADKCSEL